MLTRRGLVGALLVGGALVLPPAWQPCTSTYDALLNRWETRCPDGTRAVSTWNGLLERWETTITAPPAGSPRPAPWGREHR
jgi:hypothetical protein